MSYTSFYRLTDVPDFIKVLNNIPNANTSYNVSEYSTKSNEKYKIVRYNKEMLINDLIPIYGLLRSVVINSQNRVVCFAPPKSIPAEKFMENFEKKDSIVAEEFVEGTMINVFFDTSVGVSGCWQIATRNTIGGDVSFYKNSSGKTFHQMFLEACAENNFNIQILNPEYCYSFVLQHPNNRIVVPFNKTSLYLVEIYKIVQQGENIDVYPLDIDYIKQFPELMGGIKFPQRYEYSSYSELINEYASPNTRFDIMGVVIKNKVTNERTKIRNPIYEEVRHLRGNQPKLQYQYLALRNEGKVAEFLKYYPEMREEFSKFRDQVHMFTNTLHQNYLSCYVRKERPLIEFGEQYRTHMYKIHQLYLNDLRAKKYSVTNSVVINYVNTMHPSLLMYSLNYNMRKRFIETQKVSEQN
jgi:hypothetical protein